MLRHEKVANALKREISTIIHDDLKDPRLGFVTIVDVELTQDLRSAKVFYSVLGKEEEHKKSKTAIDSSVGFIRKLVGERVKMRYVPEIFFREDRSAEYSVRIEEILGEIKKEEKDGH